MRKQGAAAFLVGLLVLTGCTAEADKGEEAGGSSVKRAKAVTVAGPEADFGQKHKFDDGLEVSVTSPELFGPSPKALTGGEPEFVKLKVRLKNNTPKRVDPASVTVMVQSGDGQGGDVLDPRNDMTGAPAKSVAPGGRVTWTLGFGVLDADDVKVELQAGMEREPLSVGG